MVSPAGSIGEKMKNYGFLLAMVMMGAGTAEALQVTPTYQIFTIAEGKKVQGQSTVINNEGERITVTVSAKDWFVLPENKGFKAKDWLTFSQSTFTLEPGASANVTFFVQAPKKASGELVGMMSYAFNGAVQTNLQKVLSVAIYGSVSGTEKMKGQLKAVMVTPSSGTLTVSLLVRNEGNVHIRPEGWCEIQNEKRETLANIFIKQGAPTYPGKESVYTGQVQGLELKEGAYKALIHLSDVDRNTDIVKETKNFEILGNNSVDMK